MIKKGGMQLRNAPDIPVLHQMLSKAVQKGGEKQYASWRNADNLLITLEVVSTLKERKLIWQLYCEKAGRKIELCQCVGHDILMVYNQVLNAVQGASSAATRPDDVSRLNRTREARNTALDKLQAQSQSAQNSEKADKAVTIEPARPSRPVERPVTAEFRPIPDPEPDSRTTQNPTPNPAPVPNTIPAPVMPERSVTPPPTPGSAPASGPSSALGPAVSPNQSQSGANSPPPNYFKEIERPRRVESQKPADSVPSSNSFPSPSAGSNSSANQAPAQPHAVPPSQAPFPNPVQESFRQVTPPLAAPRPQPAPQPQPSSQPQPDKQTGQRPASAQDRPADNRSSDERPAAPEQGDLKSISLIKLLKQYKGARVSGRLRVDTKDASAVLYLNQGEVLQAMLGELTGDEALTEILLLGDGNFSLSTGISTGGMKRTVETPAEVLLANHRQMAHLVKELQDYGMSANSTFVRADASLTKAQFLQIAAHEAPMDPEVMAGIYIKLDGKQTLADLAKSSKMPRLKLVEAIYHMVSFELVDISNAPASVAPKQLTVIPKKIDGTLIQSVMMSLRREDTGLFIYPAFLYFLEEEFFRIYRSRGTLSVVLFEMRDEVVTEGGVKRRVLPGSAVADAARRITAKKRHTDVVGHYEAYDFAIMLPDTGPAGAKVFVKKITKYLTETALTGMDGRKLSLTFASASIPEDFTNLNSLLGACELTLDEARNRGKIYLQYGDLLKADS